MIDEIVEKTRREVEIRKSRIPADMFELDGEVRSLREAILGKTGRAVITEIKPSSPSMGDLNSVDAAYAAGSMERGGACAISVLTEPFFFHGSLANLQKAKGATTLPIIRKDFIVDEYQLLEARHYGADAVLLMVAVLGEEIRRFCKKTRELGMEALVEVHDKKEIKPALSSGAEIIGINNRNLRDLSVDLNTTKELRGLIQGDKTVVSESGVKTRADLDFILRYADAALVGTSLMMSDDIEGAVRGLVG